MSVHVCESHAEDNEGKTKEKKKKEYPIVSCANLKKYTQPSFTLRIVWQPASADQKDY